MENILVVDSSDLICSGLKKKLEYSGFVVYLAKSKKECEYYITEKFITFFGVIVEMDLDDADDKIEFVKYFTNRRIAIIVLSSLNSDDIVAKISDERIVDYIVKEKEEDLNYAVDMMSRIRKYQKQKVLLVHHDREFLNNTKESLETLMFNVLVAQDAPSALEIIEKQEDIKLALINSELASMDGFELTLRLRKNFSKEDLIIVAIANPENPSITSKFLKYGANGYVTNQCTQDELNYKISNLMDVLHNKEEAIKIKQRIEEYTTKLSKYVSPQIYQSIITGSNRGKMEAKRKKLTVFFITPYFYI